MEVGRGWVEEGLAGRGWRWAAGVFLLCASPGLLNALHITSYVFLARPPPHACRLPQPTNWTFSQLYNLTTGGETPGEREGECSYLDYDYGRLTQLGYDEAERLVSGLARPRRKPCDHGFIYDEPLPSQTVVSQWDLVCWRGYLRSSVQAAVAAGKFVGALTFGVVADKVGRQRTFQGVCLLYMAAGPAAAWAPTFFLFTAARFTLGLAGSAVYETGYTLLTELTVGKARTRLSCIYGIFYPVGMLLLPVLAYYSSSWRQLQAYLSVPAFLLIINCWFVVESPRWLLAKGKVEAAKKIVNKGEDTVELSSPSATALIPQQQRDRGESAVNELGRGHAWYKRLLVLLRELLGIFSHAELRKRALVCFYSWFVASLAYYSIALNGRNLSANEYWYVALNGLVEAGGYLVPVALLSYLGRRPASILLLLASATSLFTILFLPPGMRTVGALCGRLWVSSVFSVITLHNSELFPTSHRNTALGLSLTMAQLGSIGAPYLVDILGKEGWYLPSTVCGSLCVVAGLLVLLLPETKDLPLMDTVDQLKTSKSSTRT